VGVSRATGSDDVRQRSIEGQEEAVEVKNGVEVGVVTTKQDSLWKDGNAGA